MPTFNYHGNIVHFAAYKHHIRLYPGPKAIELFRNELTMYKTSKGTVHFPIDKPLPYELIRKMVEFNLKENKRKAESKKKKTSKKE
jgi:uncharacterized protein YdhG (YjbR/CyaY superfamily)